jgi:hypothetical protein
MNGRIERNTQSEMLGNTCLVENTDNGCLGINHFAWFSEVDDSVFRPQDRHVLKLKQYDYLNKDKQ